MLMRPPEEMKTPAGRLALGEAEIQRISDKRNYAPHGATAITRAALMLDFASRPSTQFHASYFAAMADLPPSLVPVLG